MKRLVLVSSLLFLSACGDDPQALKAGSKLPGTNFVMVEDSQVFSSMNKCVEELKRISTEEYSLTIDNDSLATPRMHVITGADSEGIKFMNTCSAVSGKNVLRIMKNDGTE